MTPPDEAIANGQAALTEHAAKQFLAGYGIPIPREWEGHCVEEALLQP